MTARPIRPAELLDLAYDLTGRGAGAGRPRTIRLRRGVSTAYYALFHRLTTAAADKLYRPGGSTPQAAAVTRWIAHTDLRNLAESVALRPTSAVAVAVAPVHADLRGLCTTFTDLQDARHRADYDHSLELTRGTAIGYVDVARDAITWAEALSASTEPSFDRFLALALGGVRIAKAR